jgi:hypothetical protein
MTSPPSATCPACGAPAGGNFCSGCGANLVRRACAHCQAELSAQARFCHRCGQPVGANAALTRASSSDRKIWLAAGTVCVLLVGGILYQVSRDASGPAAPDMANVGSSTGLTDGGLAGPAPDISTMTPRERFDRLYNRIMQASERSDSAEVERFTPMALGAYRQLDTRNADARYHAAVLQMQVGNFTAARALADTIIRESPGHLFGYVIRATAARLQNDPPALARARRDFLSHYDAEMRAKRAEYLEHQPVVDELKREAERGKGGTRER